MTNVTINGHDVNFDAATELMDDELRERVHSELAPCDPQVFTDRYAELHRERFGEDFAVN